MLRRVQIANFKCLKDVKVELQPLTVLIGPNDSGKSVFLDAVSHLVNLTGIHINDIWRRDPAVSVSIRGETDRGIAELTLNSSRAENPAVQSLRPIAIYHLPSEGVTMESPGHRDDEGPPPIDSKGEGVPRLLDYLLRRDRKRFFRTVDAIRNLVPGLEDVDIATPQADKRRLDLVIENGFRIPADASSAGVRLLLVFVALAYHPSPPKTILIEEPETGVHPKRLADVVKLLREITQGQHGGQAAQVILTTHSPYLLDFVDLDQDQILVFQRNADGSRSAQAADADRLKVFLDEFLLGEVWYNQGEEGLLAQRP